MGNLCCKECGSENPDGKKFCGDCGAPLANLCPKCGAENAAGKRFCGDCGTALGTPASLPPRKSEGTQILVAQTAAPDSLPGERKTVTALFADIQGSTELEQNLDPEEARAIIDPALKLMIEAVERYDGYVVQSTGDGIFAIFGAPVAHEDHPQRALYAALRMQEEMRRYSARLRESGNLSIDARVGSNTGEVVVRSIATGRGHTEYTPIGHTTNLASRLQALAPIGSIAITGAMGKLVEGYFALKPLGPARVKGVSEPVEVLEVTGLGPLRTRIQRSAGRGLTKFVGRDRELDAMRNAAQRAKAGHGQIVAAVADAGAGKSRLVLEFKSRNQSGWKLLEALSVSYGKASAYLPVIEMLHDYFRIGQGDDARKRREKVAARIAILDRALEDTLPYLFGLLSILEGDDTLAQMDAQVRKRRTLEAVKRILLRESLNQPVMLIFEDLHWIDDETQALLNLLADSIANAKILLLVNYRREYSHTWSSKSYYTQLQLDSLGTESAEEMLSALIGNRAELAALKQVIVTRTDGNPFFMEETVQTLLEEGALVRNGVVKLTKPVEELKIPATVQAILAARIDRLSQGAKDLLQTLAVIGSEFARSLVQRIVDTTKEDNLYQMLGDLQIAEFIYEQPVAHDIGYTFKHALTQEVAYNSLLMERRKYLHERAAQALESMFATQLDDHLGQLALHYVRSNNVEKAIEYLGRAGQQDLQRSAYADAIDRLTAATDLLRKLPERPDRCARELLLQLALGPALMAIKGYAATEVETAYTRALDLSHQLGDESKRFSVLYGLWAFYLVRGELEKSRDIGVQLFDLAQAGQDVISLVAAHWALGCSLFWMGELISAREQFTSSLRYYEPQLHEGLTFSYGQDPQVSCFCYLAFISWKLGYPDQALTIADKAIAHAREIAHPYDEALSLGLTSMLYQLRREVGVSLERAQRVRALSLKQGFPFWEAVGLLMQGWAQQETPADGLAMTTEGLRMYQALGSGIGRTWLLALLSETAYKAGDFDLGLETVNQALSEANRTGERCYEAELYRLRGEITLARSRVRTPESQFRQDPAANDGGAQPSIADSQKQAEADFLRALQGARRQHAKSWELRALMSLTPLWELQGKGGEALAQLSEVYNWFDEGLDTKDLQEARALLNHRVDRPS
jgi:class 3 adenylate cyclase